MNSLTPIWEQTFDKIYMLITPSEYKSYRFSRLLNVGLLDARNFSFRIATDPMLHKLFFRTNKEYLKEFKGNEKLFATSLEHYQIWREAYELGYSRILILESDIAFIKDHDLIRDYLKALRYEECVLFSAPGCCDLGYYEGLQFTDEVKYVKFDSWMWGASFISLSSEGLKKAKTAFLTIPRPCDIISHTECDFYIPQHRLGVPIPIKGNASDGSSVSDLESYDLNYFGLDKNRFDL